ncbi:MAG: hypothetical protein HKN87_08980 [Saprospiraceae bacterium]|nr:hypothetical protein [Saprospiraceae bacterium]
MMRYLYTMLIMASIVCPPMAQTEEGVRDEVVVELKRGIVLRGQFTEVKPGVVYALKTLHGDTVRIPHRLLRSVKYSGQMETAVPKFERAYSFREQGLYMTTAFGLLFSSSVSTGGLTGIELSASVGHQLNRLLGVGFGTGLDFYHPRGEEVVLPLFVEARGYFLENKVTPYYAIRAGYGIALKNEAFGIVGARGGWMLNPVLGWRLGGRSGANVTIDVGMKFQKAELDFARRNEESHVQLLYKRLNARIGILF